MNEVMIRSLLEGMKNVDKFYGARRQWYRGHLQEAAELLENRDEMLEQHDCYDYLFE